VLALILVSCAGCSEKGGPSPPASTSGLPPQDAKFAEIVGSGKSTRDIRASIIEELKKRDGASSKTRAPKKRKG
jgi:hypothetical protein